MKEVSDMVRGADGGAGEFLFDLMAKPAAVWVTPNQVRRQRVFA